MINTAKIAKFQEWERELETVEKQEGLWGLRYYQWWLQGIYQIVCLATGKSYVGQTRNSFRDRRGDHVRDLMKGTHKSTYLQNSWNKYGPENFQFRVLEIIFSDNQKDFDVREEHWFGVFRGKDRPVPEFNTNKTATPGPKNLVVSTETRAKLALAGQNREITEETRAKLRRNTTLMMADPEIKERIRLAHVGAKRSEQIRENLRKAQAEIKADPVRSDTKAAKISKANKGKKRTAEAKAALSASQLKNTTRCHPVDQVCPETGIVIATYKSVGRACQILGLAHSQMKHKLMKEETYHGYYWVLLPKGTPHDNL
jgi:group I intron endonuclease